MWSLSKSNTVEKYGTEETQDLCLLEKVLADRGITWQKLQKVIKLVKLDNPQYMIKGKEVLCAFEDNVVQGPAFARQVTSYKVYTPWDCDTVRFNCKFYF